MHQSSPLHAEMLAFLRNHVKTKTRDIPVLIDSALQQQTSPELEGMVQHVNRLIQENENKIESRWLSSLSKQEFELLNLGAYYPRIYRGLPRLYHRDDPSRSIIQENFHHLHLLKLESIDRAMCSLFADVPIEGVFRLIILTHVIADDLGDYIAAIETARILKEALPALQITLILVSAQQLPPVEGLNIEVAQEWLSDAQIKILREADLVIQIPTFYPHTAAVLYEISQLQSDFGPPPIVQYISKYGYVESSWFHPKTLHRSMGLHALEKGIFTKRPLSCRFQNVENVLILNALFGTTSPSQLTIEEYRFTHRFHLAHLASNTGGAIFLHALIKRWEHESLDIDICTPDLTWLMQWLSGRSQGNPLLFTCGIKEIVLVVKEGNHKITISEQGKTLRIISPGLLSHTDMQKLMYLSDDWVAVQGDQGLSEAIATQKPFFYDGRPPCLAFLKDLIALATNRLSAYKPTIEIFQAMKESLLWNLPETTDIWVDETHFQMKEKKDIATLAAMVGDALRHPTTSAGYKHLSAIVTSEHSFNPFLTSLVRRELFYRLHPHLKSETDQWLELYGKGEINLTTLVKNIQKSQLQNGFARKNR